MTENEFKYGHLPATAVRDAFVGDCPNNEVIAACPVGRARKKAKSGVVVGSRSSVLFRAIEEDDDARLLGRPGGLSGGLVELESGRAHRAYFKVHVYVVMRTLMPGRFLLVAYESAVEPD